MNHNDLSQKREQIERRREMLRMHEQRIVSSTIIAAAATLLLGCIGGVFIGFILCQLTH